MKIPAWPISTARKSGSCGSARRATIRVVFSVSCGGSTTMNRLLWLFLLMLCIPGFSRAQQTIPAPPADVAIRAGKVLDVRTGKYAANQIIWVQGQRIKAIGNAADIEKQLPAGVKTTDLSRFTVLPGLIDCHT